jgi:hypothetical protein
MWGKAKRGAKRKEGKRTAAGRLVANVDPNQRILERRLMFAWLRPSKGLDGRHGTIDQDICDGIGQLHALGLLDGHGHDPQDMRDKGRFWGHHYAKLLRVNGFKTQSYERQDKGRQEPRVTKEDEMFDRMDTNLPSFERDVLLSLIVDPLIGSDPFQNEITPWAQSLIDEALLAKGKVGKFMRFPDANDRALLDAAVRGLAVLIDGSLPSRWEKAA